MKEQSKPYLNYKQEDELLEDKARLEKMLSPNMPAHIQNQIQDRPGMSRQLDAVKQQLRDDAPHAYKSDQLDGAIARANTLKEQWQAGMPTGSEMRRNSPGALDKHMNWESRNKKAILEWKNIQRRLHASGVDVGGERSCADIEKHRIAKGGPSEGNLDGGQIRPTEYYLPDHIEIKNVMSDEDKVARGITPDDMNVVLDKLAEVQRQLDDLKKSKHKQRADNRTDAEKLADKERMAAVRAKRKTEQPAAA